ncbi:hypothetical protein F441_10449 [Phytophthora nicotianae CJ01A1]|uniref:Uncharacterized protein n=1 Tax=Phytophthora nicotianae CJ01A1 TaxID=1317063 RepID=W2WYE5_PHYNI|nr:hypothetical protein F441_10449 [Phytophthora nicotianae CJ01A1]
MVDDPARNMYTPVYFVLCTSKNETMRLKKERLTEDKISIAMAPGVLDTLTAIDPDFVNPKGIAWVKQEIKRKCCEKGCVYSSKEWCNIWRYFRKTWLERYFITEWNIFGITNSVVAQTNNPLERLNREMNAAFKPHPNLRQFVSTIGRMSSAYARKQTNITQGFRRKKQRPPRISLPPVSHLMDFEVPPESDNADANLDETDASLESLSSDMEGDFSLRGDSSLDEEPTVNAAAAAAAEGSEQEIVEAANHYDFSLN